MKKPILSVTNLSISVQNKQENKSLINGSSFCIYPNEIVGIVGESGSGKSITALAIMGLLSKKITQSGQVIFNDVELHNLKDTEFKKIRGSKISMIFQEPMSALTPSMTCGNQIAEILNLHTSLSKKEINTKILELFNQVKLANPIEVYNKYPHQISGGQKQRVMIAIAIACKPNLLIADEPTTALDVTVQSEIIQLLKEIQLDTQMSILFISHDLALVSEIAQKTLVMCKGNIVEQGNTLDVFHTPKEIYTQALIASRPSTTQRLKKLPTIEDYLNKNISCKTISTEERNKEIERIEKQEVLLEVKNVSKEYITSQNIFSKKRVFKALNNINIKVYEGETLGLVGESGCGKSTLANAILMLNPPSKGTILYKGVDITKLKKNDLKKLRKDIQIIFQDPFASLNPKKTVLETIIEPMIVHKLHKNNKDRKQKVIELLQKVGLGEEYLNRYPHEFSGGQRQRIGIARTIAVEPKLIICDESVSALDISVQAQVLNLLNDLKKNHQFTYIFISHDLAVVKYMSDHITVMQKGKIEEYNEADTLYNNPQKEYTKNLIAAIPKGI